MFAPNIMPGYPQNPVRTHTNVLGRRIAAHIVDSMIWFVVLIVPPLVLSAVVTGQSTVGESITMIGGVIGLVLFLGYWLLLEGIWDGHTIGKKAFGIKVVKANGGECTIVASVIRNLFRSIDGLFLYIPALIAIVLSDKRQRIGDYFAGTVVVREHKKEA
jgi:uncharacterized RDD family membrane protein YckC